MAFAICVAAVPHPAQAGGAIGGGVDVHEHIVLPQSQTASLIDTMGRMGIATMFLLDSSFRSGEIIAGVYLPRAALEAIFFETGSRVFPKRRAGEHSAQAGFSKLSKVMARSRTASGMVAASSSLPSR